MPILSAGGTVLLISEVHKLRISLKFWAKVFLFYHPALDSILTGSNSGREEKPRARGPGVLSLTQKGKKLAGPLGNLYSSAYDLSPKNSFTGRKLMTHRVEI